MKGILEKVTIFITRNKGDNVELLLIHNPSAGTQIPAGTVEEKESHLIAAMRETKEETGITEIKIKNYIGFQDLKLQDEKFVVLNGTKVYSRPDSISFDWAYFRRGIYLDFLRSENDFYHMNYSEYDDFLKKNYITYSIKGWIPSDSVTNVIRRHFYHFEVDSSQFEEWNQYADGHVFKLKWYSIYKLPSIVSPQNEWLDYTSNKLGYSF